MHGASHNLEVNKNNIIIKERKIDCNSIIEALNMRLRNLH